MICHKHAIAVIKLSVLMVLTVSVISFSAEPPAPLNPVPSSCQLAWQKGDLMLMTCFGLPTFAPNYSYNCALGGVCDTNPMIFNPVAFDANQWVAAAKAGRFKGILAMAKHEDGFCNWQTRTTRYSVAASPWKGGNGDVIKEIADACHAAGLRFGIYCSPFDKHYGDSEKVAFPTYTDYFGAQLRELLTNYGTVDQIWFDGNGNYLMGIDWEAIYQIVLSCHQPLVSFQGFWITDTASIRVWWVGNEDGVASETLWSVYPAPADSDLSILQCACWMPSETDVSLEGLWFWEDWRPVQSLERFKGVYLKAPGRNSIGMINIAPNPSGLIDTSAVNRLVSFGAWVDSIYSMNIASGKTATASSVRENDPTYGADKAIDTAYDTYWAPESTDAAPSLEVDLNGVNTIRMFILQEYIPLGQRVANHTIQTWDGNQWNTARFIGDSTRWSSCSEYPGRWWMVDLGQSYAITGTEVVWQLPGHVYKYVIESSSDSVTWSVSADNTANTNAVQVTADHFIANARYVRITVTGTDPGCTASFFDFRVFDSNGTNIALNKPAIADCEIGGYNANRGNDDDFGKTSTIGFKRILCPLNPIEASKVRLIVNRTRSFPLINNFGVVGTPGTNSIKWAGSPATRQSKLAILTIRRGHIRLLAPVAKNIIVELLRLDGRMLKRQQFLNTSGTLDFSIPPHASGVFILKASIGGKSIDYETVFLQ
jgi:alpha-L-fucosidase